MAAEISATQAQLTAQMQDFLHAMATQAPDGGTPFFVVGLTIFVLACFVGYYVVWSVTPALQSSWASSQVLGRSRSTSRPDR